MKTSYKCFAMRLGDGSWEFSTATQVPSCLNKRCKTFNQGKRTRVINNLIMIEL